MQDLYSQMDAWQQTNSKRFLSMTIHQEDGGYACIALTNPSEVVIVCREGFSGSYKEVGRDGDKLCVKAF